MAMTLKIMMMIQIDRDYEADDGTVVMVVKIDHIWRQQ